MDLSRFMLQDNAIDLAQGERHGALRRELLSRAHPAVCGVGSVPLSHLLRLFGEF